MVYDQAFKYFLSHMSLGHGGLLILRLYALKFSPNLLQSFLNVFPSKANLGVIV